MIAAMKRNWWMIALRGVVAILLGILIILDPSVVITFIGVFALVDGVFGVIQAFGQRGTNNFIPMLLEGLLGILIGVLVLLNPLAAAATIAIVAAIWLIGTGIIEIVLAIRLRKEIKGEFWLGLGGAVSIIAGVIALMLPLLTFLTLTWIAAGYAVAFGVVLILLAFRVRNYNGSEDVPTSTREPSGMTP